MKFSEKHTHKGKGQEAVVILAVNGIWLHIFEDVIHPAHVHL